MTEHLPECFASLCECDDTHFKSIDCDFSCICPSLRACEKRVREEIDREAFVLDEGDPFRQAYRKGLDAAREAVASMVIETVGNSAATVEQAVSAIDALREKP